MSTIKTAALRLTLLDEVSRPAGGIAKALENLDGRINGFDRAIRQTQGDLLKATGIAAAAGAALAVPIKAAIDFESALADVRKVVDFDSPEAFTQMGDDILELSRRLPMAADGIAALVAAAGQSGLDNSELLAFAEMAAQVGIAWDVTADEAGEAMAKLKTSLGLTVAETGLLADAINHLGNSTAASAPDILNFTRRVAPMAGAFGLTAEQAAGMGAAMIGAGFEAQVASTSFLNMGRSLTAGASATERQMEALGMLGLEASEVSRRMQVDAMGQIQEVFALIREAPDHMRASLITDIFGAEARALTPLILNAELLSDTMALVGDQALYAGSAQAEYEARAATTANALQLLKNQVVAAGISFGSIFLPSVVEAAQQLGPLVNRVSEFIRENPRLIKGLVGASGAFLAFRVAALSGKLGMLLVGKESLVVARAMLRVAASVGSATAALGVFTAAKVVSGLAAARSAMIGFAASAAIVGKGGAAQIALTGIGQAALALVNPLNLAKGAAIALRTVMMFSGVGVAIAAIAAGAALLINNWDGVVEFFRGVGDGFMEAFEPVAPLFEPITSAVSDLFGWVSKLVGPVDASSEEWRGWGVAVGQAIGGFVTGTVETVTNVVNTLLGLPGRVMSLATSLRDLGLSMIQSLWDGAIAKFAELLEWARGIPGRIRDAIGNIDLGAAVSGTVDLGVRPVTEPVKGNGGHTVFPVGQAPVQVDGARADGGPVNAGSLYAVGERGIELFAPSRDGTIIPNHEVPAALGGSAVPAVPTSLPAVPLPGDVGRRDWPAMSVHAPISLTMHVNGGGPDIAAQIEAAAFRAVEKAAAILDKKLKRTESTLFTSATRFGDW